MRAARLMAPGRFEMQDIDVPEPGPGEVLVRVGGAGLCGSDVHIVHMKSAPFPFPMTLGHETAGVVEKWGSGVKGLERGQRVLVAGIWGCGQCRACLEGRENACEYWARRSPVPRGPGLGFNGGMAEFMVAPARSLYQLGDLDPVQAAPLGDAGVTPCHAINLVRSHLRGDATVVVIGVGGLGHMALQILRATTACRLIAVDTDAGRLNASRAHGADDTVLSDAHAAATLLQMTGGLGALGSLTAIWLLQEARCSSSVLMGRSGRGSAGGLPAARGGVWASVLAVRCDTASRSEWGVVVSSPAGTVAHSGGCLADSLAQSQTARRFDAVLAPKVAALSEIGEARAGGELAMVFSSIAVPLASAGQANYVAANASMDLWVELCGHRGSRAASIQWGAWGGRGMTSGRSTVARAEGSGIGLVSAEVGVRALHFTAAREGWGGRVASPLATVTVTNS